MFYVIEIIEHSPNRRSEEWIAFRSETAYVTNKFEKAIKFHDKQSAGAVIEFVASKYKTRGMLIREIEDPKAREKIRDGYQPEGNEVDLKSTDLPKGDSAQSGLGE